MCARFAAGQDGRVGRFYDEKLYILDPLFEDFPGACGSPPRTDSNDEPIESAATDLQDFLRGGLAVDLWIGRIAELLQHEVVGMFSKNFFSFIDGAPHKFQPMS